jgi:AGZA family xanthine/uracil permease-like MFS transporter
MTPESHAPAAPTSWRQEIVGGLTTFATMAYILFVNPAILSDAGGSNMDGSAVLVATAVSSALATLLMGFVAGYPIALAPGMGLNAFFSYTLCGSMGYPWQAALAMVFVSGLLFFLLTLLGLRQKVLAAIPRGLQFGIATGIGLFLAFIGFQHAGWVVDHPVTLVALGDLSSPSAKLAAFGLVATIVLLVRRVPGAILLGILLTGAAGVAAGVIENQGIAGRPPSIAPTFGRFDFAALATAAAIAPLLTLVFIDLLDALGTIVGVCERGGFLVDGQLPGARRALLADSGGTMVGAVLGTSTVTAYIESAAGVSQGARTWRSNVVVAALFLASLFFAPLFSMLGGGVPASPGSTLLLYPVTAPALIIVGSYMAAAMRKIDWDNYGDSLPAFVTMMSMPVTFSIADGLAFGFIATSVVDLLRPGGRRVGIGIHALSILFLLRYVFL